ncbi:GNAT family N-acetyltransferase [Aquirufa antheringensis]
MQYKCLSKIEFPNGKFNLVPIRFEDRYEIMKWRNEQIYHLRQNKPLTFAEQDLYFENIISQLFHNDNPKQILFSLLENGDLVGYGGLVNINWIDSNAEISFIMKTELERENFNFYWRKYLIILEKVAFNELMLHKIYTYAFDVRPHLYKALIDSGYYEEVRLKEHCYFEGKYLDVVIHSKINIHNAKL